MDMERRIGKKHRVTKKIVLRGIIIFELDYVCGDCVDLKIRKDAGEGKKKSDISL